MVTTYELITTNALLGLWNWYGRQDGLIVYLGNKPLQIQAIFVQDDGTTSVHTDGDVFSVPPADCQTPMWSVLA